MNKIADKSLIPYVLVDPALLENVNEWDVVFGDQKSYMIHKDTGEEHTFDTQYLPKWYADDLAMKEKAE